MNKLLKTIADNGARVAKDKRPAPEYTKIMINRMELDMFIGCHDFEKTKSQKVIVSVEALVSYNEYWESDALEHTLNYENIVNAIKYIAKRGHINLVETFAEHIAEFCLREDLVKQVTVRVEKPDIYEFISSTAVEILRIKPA